MNKINIEIKLSKNYNTISLGLLDEPIIAATEEEFKNEIRKKAELLRKEVEYQLSQIGGK